jgi:hypothetical protein
MAMPKDNEAPLPMSSPPVPMFKEALLPLSPKEKEASTLPSSPIKVIPQQDLYATRNKIYHCHLLTTLSTKN